MRSLGTRTRYFPCCPSPFFFTALTHKVNWALKSLSFRKIYRGATLWHGLFCQSLGGTYKQLYIPALARDPDRSVAGSSAVITGVWDAATCNYLQCRRNSRVIPSSVCRSHTRALCRRSGSLFLGAVLQINDLWSGQRAMLLTTFSLCFFLVPLLTQHQQRSFSPTCHFDRSHGLMCDACPAGYVGPRCER